LRGAIFTSGALRHRIQYLQTGHVVCVSG
jgi:hypothetical protein